MPSPATATLLVSRADPPGIAARLARVVHGHGASLLDADRHTDTQGGVSLQRIAVFS